MGGLLNVGELVAARARLTPDKIGACDLERRMSFRTWNERACRLANALSGLGLREGDRFCVLAYNRLEWAEIYIAAAKGGFIVVPINFRLVGREAQYIIENCQASALIVEDPLIGTIEQVRAELTIPSGRYIHIGEKSCPTGYSRYEELITNASAIEPDVAIDSHSPWALMYTSGTTGNPKGASRSHFASMSLSMCTAVELRAHDRDNALLVMPMCHANSLFFFGTFIFSGATCTIYSRQHLDPGHLVHTLATSGATFTSLVPTHYIMMMELSAAERARHNVDHVSRLMISSAPARRETKLEIMDYFRKSGLFEGYGSTEAGWVTMLHPDEQFTKLGSVGRETVGSGPIKLLDPDGNEIADGEVGELYSRTPSSFDGYWDLPQKTAEAFRGPYCSVGDMARRDAEGFIELVDRKSNMIISGGENIYPSEVETTLAAHTCIKDVAVIGVPDEKWGEHVHAVVILKHGRSATCKDLLAWCKDRFAGFKRPQTIEIISDDEMPRTATGKIQHRKLRDRFTDRRTKSG